MRSSLFALVRKDLRAYFDQPTGYILIVVFVALLSWWFFRTTILTLEASLRPLFSVEFAIDRPSLPWVLAFLTPAATMRLLAEEQRDGTLELLLTQPVRAWIVLLGKFLAGFLFVTLWMAATLGIPLALETAGDMDWGAVVAQYVGGMFLAASFVAIGLFTSSLTRNQIVAFLLGLTFIVLLMLMGLEQVAVTLPDRVAGLVQSLSPVTHFSSIARGVIDLRDVLYFVALTSTFLSATFLTIRGKSLSHFSPQYRNLQLGVAGLIVFSLLVGWFGSSIGGRLDLTSDKLFTLSPGTVKIISDLDDLVTITLYKSKDPPPQISLVTRDVTDFLRDFAAGSDGKVKIVEKFPLDDPDARREASLAGIPPREFAEVGQTEVSRKIGYLGLTMTYTDRREVLPFIPTVDGFEYRLASQTNKMIANTLKSVAFLTGYGEKAADVDLTILAGELQGAYEVRQVSAVDGGSLDLSGVDVLIIAGPTQQVPDAVQESLHGYLANGGKAMVLIDMFVVDPSVGLVAIPNPNSFAGFVSRYGIVVDENLVFDLRSHETLVFTTQLGDTPREYPYWMRVPIADQKVAGGVQSAVLPWASPLGITDAPIGEVDVVPLLETTSFAAIDFNPGDLRPNSPVFDNVTQQNLIESLMGVTVTGRGDAGDTTGDFRLVIVGDSDWLTDSLANRSPDNLLLALNLIDWLAQEDALASVRDKVVSSRQLLFSSTTHQRVVRLANVVGVPILFVIIGFVRFFIRRRVTQRSYSREK
ncbi:MAG: Gldg family protein [Chloroflexi bacterium]|nr:Gldg family protein [Chloroflexota bacterium]